MLGSQFALPLVVLFFIQIVSAQFNIFDMFNQQAQQQQRGGSGGASQWSSHADSIPCSAYLCPDTLVCARNPVDCPCPAPEDEKCIIRDAKNKESASIVCVRGKDGCAEVDRLAGFWK